MPIDLESHVEAVLQYIGEDTSREGLLKTPARYLRALDHLTKGYRQSVDELINGAIFEVPEARGTQMVVVRNIELYSLCEHHLLPFFGKCHVAYLPKGRIIGLSKIARIVDVFSRRLQVQERMTGQIAHCLMEKLNPLGVGVVVEASHLCMMMRGVEKQNAAMRTCSLLGEFEKSEVRSEFLTMIQDR